MTINWSLPSSFTRPTFPPHWTAKRRQSHIRTLAEWRNTILKLMREKHSQLSSKVKLDVIQTKSDQAKPQLLSFTSGLAKKSWINQLLHKRKPTSASVADWLTSCLTDQLIGRSADWLQPCQSWITLPLGPHSLMPKGAAFLHCCQHEMITATSDLVWNGP